jgi:hypothetical protein
VELLRDEVPPDSIPDLVRGARIIRVGGPGFRFPAITYFNGVLRYGSPATSPPALATAAEPQRRAVDEVLLKGHDLTLSNAPGRVAAARDCRPASGQSANGARTLVVPDAGLVIFRPHGSRSGLDLEARRFATAFQRLDVPHGSGALVLRPGSSQEVRSWQVRISGGTVCQPG